MGRLHDIFPKLSSDRRKWPIGRVRPDDPAENTRDHERLWHNLNAYRRLIAALRGRIRELEDDVDVIGGGGGDDIDDVILTSEPYAFWKLDETSGSTASDSSGGGRHLTVDPDMVTPTWGGDPLVGDSPSAEFVAGVADGFVMPTFPALDDNWTVVVSVRADDNGPDNHLLCGQGNPISTTGTGWWLQLETSSGKLFLQFNNGVHDGISEIRGNNALTLDGTTTYRVSVSRSAGVFRLHVDGLLQTATSSAAFTPSSGFLVGEGGTLGAETPYNLDGLLAYLGVWSRVLSGDEQLEQVEVIEGGGERDPGLVWMIGADGDADWLPENDPALVAHLADTTDAHDASAISLLDTAADFTATDVEGALAELQAADELDEAALTAHVGDAVAAHAATAIAFTPDGSIAATTVQAAIVEVRDEAVGGSAHTIEDEGTPVTDRAKLNFVGAGVAVTDDAGNGASVVTISGAAGTAGHTIEEEGTSLAARAKLNFVGAGVTVTDDSGDDASVVTIPGGGSPSIVTSLPGSPSDGDECYYKVGTGDTAILWHLRYDSAITDAYKWRFLGGRPMLHEQQVGGTGASSTSYNTPTGSLTLTVPLAGVYEIDFALSTWNSTIGTPPITHSIKLGAAATADADGARTWYGGAANTVYRITKKMTRTLAASAVLQHQVKQGAASGVPNHENAHLAVEPVRVG